MFSSEGGVGGSVCLAFFVVVFGEIYLFFCLSLEGFGSMFFFLSHCLLFFILSPKSRVFVENLTYAKTYRMFFFFFFECDVHSLSGRSRRCFKSFHYLPLPAECDKDATTFYSHFALNFNTGTERACPPARPEGHPNAVPRGRVTSSPRKGHFHPSERP